MGNDHSHRLQDSRTGSPTSLSVTTDPTIVTLPDASGRRPGVPGEGTSSKVGRSVPSLSPSAPPRGSRGPSDEIADPGTNCSHSLTRGSKHHQLRRHHDHLPSDLAVVHQTQSPRSGKFKETLRIPSNPALHTQHNDGESPLGTGNHLSYFSDSDLEEYFADVKIPYSPSRSSPVFSSHTYSPTPLSSLQHMAESRIQRGSTDEQPPTPDDPTALQGAFALVQDNLRNTQTTVVPLASSVDLATTTYYAPPGASFVLLCRTGVLVCWEGALYGLLELVSHVQRAFKITLPVQLLHYPDFLELCFTSPQAATDRILDLEFYTWALALSTHEFKQELQISAQRGRPS